MAFSLDTVKAAVLQSIDFQPDKILDVGAGDGKLLAALAERFPSAELHATDYTSQFMKFSGCELRIANIDLDPLPYLDSTFDLVVITEVVEHLENYHRVLREIHRILSPGGMIVVTTPNILSLKSRISFVKTGFWNLFGPLPLDSKRLEGTAGHITPVHYFHLVYSLSHAGYSDIKLDMDKAQKTSMAMYGIFLPFIVLFRATFIRRERNKYKTINRLNLPFARSVNSFQALVARSILVTAKKAES